MAGRDKGISLLPGPKHHIRGSWDTHPSDAKQAGNLFPFLELDVIRHDYVGKHSFD
jgi:hypothetical protein